MMVATPFSANVGLSFIGCIAFQSSSFPTMHSRVPECASIWRTVSATKLG